MKTIIQTALLIFLSTVCLQALHSQDTVSYGYDFAGNRVSRTINFNSLKSAAAPEDEPAPAVYSEMLSDIELRIYPNPTDGLLKVEIRNLPEGQTADILLYDLSGRLITSRKGVIDFADIDISAQPSGTYLLRIIAGETTFGGSQYRTEWKIIKK